MKRSVLSIIAFFLGISNVSFADTGTSGSTPYVNMGIASAALAGSYGAYRGVRYLGSKASERYDKYREDRSVGQYTTEKMHKFQKVEASILKLSENMHDYLQEYFAESGRMVIQWQKAEAGLRAELKSLVMIADGIHANFKMMLEQYIVYAERLNTLKRRDNALRSSIQALTRSRASLTDSTEIAKINQEIDKLTHDQEAVKADKDEIEPHLTSGVSILEKYIREEKDKGKQELLSTCFNTVREMVTTLIFINGWLESTAKNEDLFLSEIDTNLTKLFNKIKQDGQTLSASKMAAASEEVIRMTTQSHALAKTTKNKHHDLTASWYQKAYKKVVG